MISAYAQTNRVLTSPDRYLFIVDTSAAMQPRAVAAQKAVGNLLRSSMAAQLHRGDTIGVWTFSDRLYSGKFPLQIWTPEATETIASNVVSFLALQSNSGPSRFEAVVPVLQQVIEESHHLTVLLVSDGDEAISGTPFDWEIERALAGLYKTQTKARMPTTTVLRASRGKIVLASVNPAPWPVQIAPFPPEPPIVETPKPAPKPEVKAAPRTNVPPLILIGKKPPAPVETNRPPAAGTNATPPTTVTPTNVPEARQAATEPKPLVPTNPSSPAVVFVLPTNQPSVTNVVIVVPHPTNPPTSSPLPEKVIPATTTSVKPEVIAPGPAIANSNDPATSDQPANKQSVASARSNDIEAAEISKPDSPETVRRTGVGIATSNQLLQPLPSQLPIAGETTNSAVASSDRTGSKREMPVGVLLGGGLLLLLGGAVLLRSRRPQGAPSSSLITSSLDKQGKPPRK